MKPLLKWAGGKTQLLDEICARMPQNFNRYIEPFFGGGALFFRLQPNVAIVNDSNRQLINCYIQVRDNLEQLLEQLDNHTNNHKEEYYYEMRRNFNNRIHNRQLTVYDAALMIYLNKAGYNGLYRVNRQGHFNTPSGKKRLVNLYDLNNIRECSLQLHHTRLLNTDFETACRYLRRGDFVFFDSPYYDTFDTYQAGGFTREDHERLAVLFSRLTQRGIFCMLTNSNTNFIRDLYEEYNIDEVNVKRMINCNGNDRISTEVIITNY